MIQQLNLTLWKPEEWNPYFVAYATVHGKAPAEMAANYLFIIWIREAWSRWRKLSGLSDRERISDAQREAFLSWLNAECGVRDGDA